MHLEQSVGIPAREKKTKQRKMEASETKRRISSQKQPQIFNRKKNSSFLFFFTVEDYSIAVARDGKTEN
jgi:hypothetical protein